MNYYPFHIGDYATHTLHLEPMEDLAYRRLLDLYYLREDGLPADIQEVARLVRMKAHTDAVEAVLKEFFYTAAIDGMWHHARCDEEIERMREKQQKAKASAEASVAARRAKAERPLSERSPTVELPTPTRTPTPLNSSSKNKARVEKPIEVSDAVWISFLQVRKAKKAAVTELAILGIRREAVKAGIPLEDALTICCERGWASFKAEWWQKETRPALQAESFYERDQRLKRERMQQLAPGVAEGSARNWDFVDGEVRDVTAIEGR